MKNNNICLLAFAFLFVSQISIARDNVDSAFVKNAIVKGDNLSDEYVGDIGNALSGKLGGLFVQRNGGEPGKDDPTYLIRGIGSFNTAGPLIYVDGFEAPVKDINPDEIESIQLLKDAAALSIFGVKGANGVIWITTKKGIIGKPKTSVNVSTGFQEATTLPELTGSYDYARLYNEAVSNDNGKWTQYYSDEVLGKYKNGDDGSEYYNLLYPNVNWYDEVLKPFAPASNADVGFSGGTEKMTYYLNLGYHDVDGLYKDTDPDRKKNSNINYQRFNYRANITANLNKVFKLETIIGGSISDRYTPVYSTSDMWENMASYPANAFPVKVGNGYGGSSIYPDNPKATALETGFRHYHYRNVQALVRLEENLDFIIKNLKLTETFSLYNNQSQTYTKSKNYLRSAPYMVDGVVNYVTYGSSDTDYTITQTGTSYNSYMNRLNEEVALTWNTESGANRIDAELLFHNDKETMAGDAPAIITRIFYGRAGYSYADRLFVNVSASYGGMSVYNPSEDMGFFPAVSAEWVALNEDSGSGIVDYLKLRGSFGIVGQNDLSTASNSYMYQQYYRNGKASQYFGWEGTSTASTLYEYYLANPDAKWEKSKKTDFGADVQLFSKRLALTADFFYDYRSDILVMPSVMDYTGILADKNFNQGVVINRGFELMGQWNDKIGDFSYGLAGNLSFARNKIVNMNEEPRLYDYQKYTGNKTGTYKALVADGLFQSWEEINDASTPVYTYESVQPGDIKYVDQNKDGFIDDNDEIFLSDYYPNTPEMYYGVNIKMAYKNIDFSLSGYGVTNYTVSVMNYLNSAYEDGTGNLSSAALKNRWAYYPEQGVDTRATATYPRLSAGTNSNNWRLSSYWLRDGSFFRISDCTVGFTLSDKISDALRINKLRLFVSGTNLAVFDSLESGDPECPTGYPLTRTYLVGINIKF